MIIFYDNILLIIEIKYLLTILIDVQFLNYQLIPNHIKGKVQV